MVDAYQETSYPIEDGISYGHDDKYFYNTPTLSAESVTISGPRALSAKSSGWWRIIAPKTC